MMVPDPDGVPRPVVEAGNHGPLINEINLKLDRRTGEVLRELTTSTNHANTRDVHAGPGDPGHRRLLGRRRATQVRRTAGDHHRRLHPYANAAGECTMGDLAADFTWDAPAERPGRPRP